MKRREGNFFGCSSINRCSIFFPTHAVDEEDDARRVGRRRKEKKSPLPTLLTPASILLLPHTISKLPHPPCCALCSAPPSPFVRPSAVSMGPFVFLSFPNLSQVPATAQRETRDAQALSPVFSRFLVSVPRVKWQRETISLLSFSPLLGLTPFFSHPPGSGVHVCVPFGEKVGPALPLSLFLLLPRPRAPLLFTMAKEEREEVTKHVEKVEEEAKK